jgi:predicted adenine nucleotide alpha hydrolase (AANH) superfamily ATPase
MKILLHICCSNCSLYPVKLLRSEKHEFTGFWFNPNIHPSEEYHLRLDSLKKLADEWKFDMTYREGYTPEDYFKMFDLFIKKSDNCHPELVSGSHGITDHYNKEIPKPVQNDIQSLDQLDSFPPFPERCKSCYQLRLEKTARQAQKEGFDAFSTTLLISPYQDFDQIISTGRALADIYNVRFHGEDYRPYFRDAETLSKEMGLYRQKYCGCFFSKEERYKKKNKIPNDK